MGEKESLEASLPREKGSWSGNLGGLVGKDAAVPQVSSASGYAGWDIFLKKAFIIPS